MLGGLSLGRPQLLILLEIGGRLQRNTDVPASFLHTCLLDTEFSNSLPISGASGSLSVPHTTCSSPRTCRVAANGRAILGSRSSPYRSAPHRFGSNQPLSRRRPVVVRAGGTRLCYRNGLLRGRHRCRSGADRHHAWCGRRVAFIEAPLTESDIHTERRADFEQQCDEDRKCGLHVLDFHVRAR